MSMTMRGGRHARDSKPPDPRPALLVAVVAAVQFAVAWVAASSATLAVGVVAGLGALVATVLAPSAVLVSVFPGSFVIERVGPASIDLSLADALTFLGVVAALPSVPWRSKAFRAVLLATLAYSALISLSVVANPTPAGAIEVVHRFVMVVGTVCIGAAVVHRGKVTAALRLAVLAACVIAVAAIADTLGNDLQPAYPFDMQKNAAGSLLVTTLVCLYFGRKHLKLPLWLTAAAGTVILGGLASTQSRGAALGLGVVFLIFMIRSIWLRKGRLVWQLLPLVLTLGVGVGVAMVASFQHESEEHTGSAYKYGSVGSRKVNYDRVWEDVILEHPIVGAAPKWFKQPGAQAYEPHNLVLHELSSDGVVGLVGLIFLLWVCLRVAQRAPPPLGELAWYAIVARIAADLFDIYWVAGPNTLPFLLLGLAVGAAALDEERVVPTAVTAPSADRAVAV